MEITELRCTACDAPVPPEAVRMALARCPFCGITLQVRGAGRGPLLCAADLSRTPPPGFWVSSQHAQAQPPELMARLPQAANQLAYVIRTSSMHDDFEAVVRLRLHWGDLKMSRAGLLFRHRDGTTYGSAFISCARSYYLGVTKGTTAASLVPWTGHDAIHGNPGDLNELALRCAGDRIELRINGALAASLRDASLSHGWVTVAGRSDLQPMAFSVVSFEVYGIAPDEAPGPGPAAPAPRVDDTYDVVLRAIDPSKKIQTIKVLREQLGVGLKDAKEMSERLPGVVLRAAPKDRAERLRAALATVGATATLA